MSKNTPAQASSIKKGHHAILKERPCRITHVSISKTGKHGHAKCHFIGNDVFYPDKKYEEICPSTHTMLQPVLVRAEYQLLDIEEDGYLSLLDEKGQLKNDLQLRNRDIDNNMKSAFDNGDNLDITILSWGEEEAVILFKVVKE